MWLSFASCEKLPFVSILFYLTMYLGLIPLLFLLVGTRNGIAPTVLKSLMNNANYKVSPLSYISIDAINLFQILGQT